MPLIKCPDCEKEVSDKATACIHCGCPISTNLEDQPAAGSAKAVEKGNTRSKLKEDLGWGVALVTVICATVVGVATSFVTGMIVAFLGIALATYITYR